MEYRLSIRKIILNILVGTIFLFIFFYLHNEEIDLIKSISITFLTIFTGTSVFFIGKRLCRIRINQNSNTVFLIYRKYFFIKYSEEIFFNNLTFSFKEEVGARGVKGKEFRIYNNNIKLLGIDCALDGWEKKTVNEIVSKFRELGLHELK